MERKSKSLLLILALLCPLFTSCEDSDNPLSDPKEAAVDTGLVGTWRLKSKDGELVYYHVGKAGDKFPAGMLRVIAVTYDKNGELSRPECNDTLAFTTKLGDNHYLNITGMDAEKIKKLSDSKWEASMASAYFIYKYEIHGDKIDIAAMDRKLKEEAIKSGKIKGVSDDNKVRMTDTTENLAKFFATPDAVKLFFTKESKGEGYDTLERVK